MPIPQNNEAKLSAQNTTDFDLFWINVISSWEKRLVSELSFMALSEQLNGNLSTFILGILSDCLVVGAL